MVGEPATVSLYLKLALELPGGIDTEVMVGGVSGVPEDPTA